MFVTLNVYRLAFYHRESYVITETHFRQWHMLDGLNGSGRRIEEEEVRICRADAVVFKRVAQSPPTARSMAHDAAMPHIFENGIPNTILAMVCATLLALKTPCLRATVA